MESWIPIRNTSEHTKIHSNNYIEIAEPCPNVPSSLLTIGMVTCLELYLQEKVSKGKIFLFLFQVSRFETNKKILLGTVVDGVTVNKVQNINTIHAVYPIDLPSTRAIYKASLMSVQRYRSRLLSLELRAKIADFTEWLGARIHLQRRENEATYGP